MLFAYQYYRCLRDNLSINFNHKNDSCDQDRFYRASSLWNCIIIITIPTITFRTEIKQTSRYFWPMIYYCKIIIKFKHLIVRISIVKIEPIYMKKRSLHKTNFARENLGFEDEKRAANFEKVEESRVSVKSILPLFPLPWNFNKSRVRGVIEGRTNNPFPRFPLWENTVTDRSPGNRVTLLTW